VHLHGPLRVLVYGVTAYVAVYFVIRMMGKRTLATMNVFDLLATVALGSTISTFVIDDGVGFTGGAIAMALPLLLQWGVAFMSSRSERAERFIKQHPAMMLWNGQLLHDMLHHEMITEDDVREAIRKAGLASIRDAKAVVLEVDGHLSVVPRAAREGKREASAFTHVKREPDGETEI
jgi:uncharacterized membrane protein YcaP (DUF421 family)